MVMGVAGGMYGAEGGAIDVEDLAVGDGLLGSSWTVFVD